MLAALNAFALFLGIAAGGLAASLVGLSVGGLLTLINVESGPDIGLIVGLFAGLVIGGWTAGRRASHSSRFHGALTGLVLAFVIVALARFGGSPASTTTVIWLAVVAALVAGASGWLAGRRKETPT